MNLFYVKLEIPSVHKMVKIKLKTLQRLMINRFSSINFQHYIAHWSHSRKLGIRENIG